MGIRPCHETLRHEDGIESVGESGYLSLISIGSAASADAHFEVHHVDDSFRDLRQITALGKSEIIEVEVIARKDDRYFLLSRFEMPFVQVHIHIAIRYGFEEHGGREIQTELFHTHSGRYLELRRGKLAHPFREGLIFDFLDVRSRERAALAYKRAEGTHLLAHDDIVLLHETVAFCKDGCHILIELDAEEDDDHATQIGKEETNQLSQADMASH